MRSLLLVSISLAACGTVKDTPLDAAAGTDAAPDSSIDAAIDAPGCQPQTLLIGGTMVEPQGWSVVTQAPATLSYGPDYVKLETVTNANATTSGQLILNYPGALTANQPFKLEVVLLVERTNPHNSFDAAVALLGSYTPPFGVGNDRSQMVYFDGGMIGWADDTQAFTTTITNNAYHTVVLSVNAANTATVTVDGVMALTRNAYVSNGAIAIGDQTNDANVDSAIRIRSIRKLCP